MLLRVAQQPGLCTKEEIARASEFLEEYVTYRDLYRSVYGTDPVGWTLESRLDELKRYLERDNEEG